MDAYGRRGSTFDVISADERLYEHNLFVFPVIVLFWL